MWVPMQRTFGLEDKFKREIWKRNIKWAFFFSFSFSSFLSRWDFFVFLPTIAYLGGKLVLLISEIFALN